MLLPHEQETILPMSESGIEKAPSEFAPDKLFVSQRKATSSMNIGEARIKTIDLYRHCMII